MTQLVSLRYKQRLTIGLQRVSVSPVTGLPVTVDDNTIEGPDLPWVLSEVGKNGNITELKRHFEPVRPLGEME